MAKHVPDPGPPAPIPRPRIEVLDRALQNPFGLPSSPVELREGGLITHWCNTELKGGSQLHYYLDAGWLKVKPDYLAHPDRFQWNTSIEGYVVRGQRENEILMYTTTEHYQQRQAAKEAENRRKMDPGVTKRDTVEAASKQLGDQGADFLNRQEIRPVGDVKTQYERIERQEGLE